MRFLRKRLAGKARRGSILSAGLYLIVMFGPVHLPPILPANPALYAFLRKMLDGLQEV